MVELTKKELRQLQMIELEMLIEVDRICRKCGIEYTIIAGTMLGAVRHHGFIPWDDDADVAMMRDEYEKFRVVCETELDTSRFYFQDYRKTEGYRWGYGKIRRKDTIFLRKNQEHMPYEQGVFIDIFPMDGVPDNYLLRSLHNLACFAIRKTLWSEVGRNTEKNIIIRLIYKIINQISENNIKKILRKFEIFSNRHATKYIRKLMFPTPNQVWGYERKWYENHAEYDFEGYTFIGIKDADEYLSFKFGAYPTFPPEKERKVHPVSQLKLLPTT